MAVYGLEDLYLSSTRDAQKNLPLKAYRSDLLSST
jgi:hypothetical protein